MLEARGGQDELEIATLRTKITRCSGWEEEAERLKSVLETQASLLSTCRENLAQVTCICRCMYGQIACMQI